MMIKNIFLSKVDKQPVIIIDEYLPYGDSIDTYPLYSYLKSTMEDPH